MIIKFLGTSNANPNSNRGQSGILLKVKNRFYLFDCGDGIATKIWLDKNIIMNNIDSIFITHMDPDHVGGLFTLFLLLNQRIKKSLENQPGANGFIPVFIPDKNNAKLFSAMLKPMRINNEKTKYKKKILSYKGTKIIYSDKNISVSSFPTRHTKEAHGFIININRKKIVYTGDILNPKAITQYIENSDVLIIEGAHFPIKDITKAFKEKNIKNLIVTHMQDERIKNPKKVKIDLKPLEKRTNILLAYDGMSFFVKE